jgi:hypothetical protein
VKTLHAVVAVLLVVAAANAATFRLEFGGARISGGEVCLFDAASLDGPVERLTTFSTVSCQSADSDVPLPKGIWNLFARHQDGYISRRLLLVRDGRVEDERRVIELARAKPLQFDGAFAKTETAAVYIEEAGFVLPLVPGERSILVPTSTTVVPLFMGNHVISRIGPPRVVDAGEGGNLTRPAPAAGRVDLAVGLVPDLEAFKQIPPRERAPGRIELVFGDKPPVPAANRVDPAFTGVDAIALFRQMPPAAGSGSVRVAGEGWSNEKVELKSFRAERPLRIAPTTTLTVHWSVSDDLAGLALRLSHAPACPRGDSSTDHTPDVPNAPERGLTLTLARCPGLQAATPVVSIRMAGCTGMASASLDEHRMAGSEIMNGVSPGVYLLRLGYEKLPRAFKTVEVTRVDAAAEIELRYDRWFGKVTRDREPLFARIAIGDGVVTNAETGEYFAISTPVPPPAPDVAARLFKDPSPIAVVGCTSPFNLMFIPEERPAPNSKFDIEIVSNNVVVRVVDAKTTGAIQGAAVEYRVERRDDPDRILVTEAAGTTDDKGELALQDIPTNREILLCASHDQYRSACADRFRMNTTHDRSVTIALEAAQLRKGRVDAPAIGGGHVYWYRPDGKALESVPIEADGTFTYKDAHAQGEMVAVVSPGTPLLVFRQPYLPDGETFEISFSAAPVRSFNVTIPPNAREVKGFVSLSIGDIVVPLAVLSDHLRSRGSRPVFLSPGAVAVRDIVASGPVSFIFAPISWAEIYFKDQSIDMFYVPAAAALPRVPAGSNTDVVIGR